MGESAVNATEAGTRRVDYDDIQGLVRFGHGKLAESAYVLARVRSPAAARAWLRAAPVTSAVTLDAAPATALQVAFTAAGLEALGVPRSVIGEFSHEFVAGMTEPSRSRRLGDVGIDAPANWTWGTSSTMPHLLAMCFARPGRLDDFLRSLTATGWSDAFEELRRLPTAALDQREPFGFTDGISQPEIDWDRRRDPLPARLRYENGAALGEFLLGYGNEYGKYTERPLLDADGAGGGLPAAEDAPDRRDLGRNGTYLVMRQLRQDVRGFWDFMLGQTRGDYTEAEALAAALVGRRPNGDPLVPLADPAIAGDAGRRDAPAIDRFDFDDDPLGVRCPIGAHIRRSNPRNADFVGRPTGVAKLLAMLGFGQIGFRDDLTSSVRFHRILRRGRKYGEPLPPAQALMPSPSAEIERGLHFICLNANISRQFEFLQNAWTMNAKFSSLSGENDPVVGNRDAVAGGGGKGRFTIPGEGRILRCVAGLPQFVTVRGGAYFFLPGLRALRYLADDAKT
jgi:deferrochelatase/peroxidase EfeB